MARILVAEDARLVRVMLSRSLSLHEIIGTGDGHEALALMREHHPEIAILDWNMPGLDGLEVVKAVRADPDLAHIRLVMMTARTDYNAEREAREAGIDHFVRKPIMPRQITSLVEQLLDSRTRDTPPGRPGP